MFIADRKGPFMKRGPTPSVAALVSVLFSAFWCESSLAEERTFSGQASASVRHGRVTTDVWEGEFPPASYGQKLEQVEATTQQVVEDVFRDEDGMLRSGVNGRTMKPLRAEEVKDRPNGLGGSAQNAAIPDSLKAIWMNYEDAGQASGTYLEALCIKAKMTGDPKVRERARRTVNAIVLLWDNASPPAGLGGGGRGWFPKPYAGIRKMAGIEECSADQYAEVTLGLHAYHRTLADRAEKKKIEEIIVSFSDWWYDHDYSGIYFGKPIWWKRLGWHPMAAAYFLYLHALVESWQPGGKAKEGFETWLKLKATLLQPAADKPTWVCMHGIALKCLERLAELRPDMNAIWRPAIAHQAALLAQSVEGAKAFASENNKAYAADHLVAAHRLLPRAGYERLAVGCLEACTRRGDFYAIRRGLPLDGLPKVQSGDDYRDVFWCENHVHWMNAYWNMRALNPPAK
jgi:hypothetical protein